MKNRDNNDFQKSKTVLSDENDRLTAAATTSFAGMKTHSLQRSLDGVEDAYE